MKIKKIILLAFAFLFVLCKTEAQVIKSYGVKIALTSAAQEWNVAQVGKMDVKKRNGINFAAYTEWLDIPFFSVVTQLEYAQRGMIYEGIETSDSGPQIIRRVNVNNRVDYFSIPVVGKFTFPIGKFSPFITCGPRIDILLGYQSDAHFSQFYDKFNISNVGATISIGSEVHDLMQLDLSLEARYNFDFADSYSIDPFTIRNNSLDIWFGVSF